MTGGRDGRSRSSASALARLHGDARRVVLAFVVTGSVAGLLESLALVLFTTGALRVTGNTAPAEIGGWTISASSTVVLGLAATAIVLAGGLHAVLARLAADASLRVLERARRRVAEVFLRTNWTSQAELRGGAMHDAMFNLAPAASVATSFGSSVFNGLIIMVTLFVAAVAIAPLFTTVLVGAVLPIIAVLRPLSRKARRQVSEHVTQAGDLVEDVATTEALAFDLQAFGVAETQLERLDDANRVSVRSMRAARFASRLAAYWFKDIALLVLILVVGLIDLIWDLTQPSAAAAILLIIRMLAYAQQGYHAYHNVAEATPGVLELVRRLDELDRLTQPVGTRHVDRLGTVALDGVGYTYPNGRVALEDVSFRIEPGRVLGIVGRSGAGKSTIAELLLRLRDPSTGRITADGVDATEIAIADWRRLVTIVPQDPKVQRASIADNITFLRPGFSRTDVEAAARAGQLHDEIVRFDDGYDTVLGSGNRGLSGGQRQRLAIARALISEPSLLVLDEPTSALDAHSERELRLVLDALRGQVTMVLIAHRASTLELCDDLLVLDRGRVVAHGPRSEIGPSVDLDVDDRSDPG